MRSRAGFIADAYGLEGGTWEMVPVARGALGQIWRLSGGDGVWAVKELLFGCDEEQVARLQAGCDEVFDIKLRLSKHLSRSGVLCIEDVVVRRDTYKAAAVAHGLFGMSAVDHAHRCVIFPAEDKPLQEPEIPMRVKVPDFAHLLPQPIRGFTMPAAIQDADHLSFLQGGGHGGSHPHLVWQFVKMLQTGEDSYPNAVESANITCTGILAHESALKGGELIRLPEWTLR